MNKTMIAMFAAMLVAPFALAAHTPEGRCDSEDAPSLGIVQVGSGHDAFYIDDRNYLLSNGIWVYEETNGIITGNDNDAAHNLQRGGSSPFIPDDNEICVDDPLVVPDLLYI